ncbi:complex I subunit 4 family protein [Nakamurella endophytica]
MIVLPLIGAIATATLGGGGGSARTAKLVALLFSLAEFVLAVVLWVVYRRDQLGAGTAGAPPFRETFSVDWIPSFGVSFSLGVDGISLVMIALIALLVPIVLGASWEERLPEGRTVGGYFALILVLQAAMTGVFAATDVFLFYVLFEVMLIPMYFLIGAFGGVRRTYAATKFFLYSLLGGLLMLASLIGLYVASGNTPARAGLGGTLDWATLRSLAGQIPESTQLWIFAGFAAAFAIKAPLVPLHTWLPDAGAEAPVGAGTLLVGVLDKVGTFGFLRICLPLLPLASSRLAWLFLLLAVLGILYGAIVAAGQTDLKRFVTYTSIAHFGFICMGVFAFTTQAISGAVLYMVNHGIATALLFLVVGMLTARGGSRLVGDYGGVWKVAPLLGGLMLVGALATIAVPGTNSFVSEFMVLIGTFTRYPAWAIVGTTGIVLAAVYMLWIFQRTMTGPVRGAAVLDIGGPEGPASGSGGLTEQPQREADDRYGHGGVAVAAPVGTARGVTTAVRRRFGDLSPREIGVLTPLVLLVLFLGVYPKPVLDVINPTAERTVVDSGHTDPAPRVPAGAAGATGAVTAAATVRVPAAAVHLEGTGQ